MQEVLSKVDILTSAASDIAFNSRLEQSARNEIMLSSGNLKGASLSLKSVAALLAPVAANDPVSKQQLSRATDRVVQRVRDVVGTVQPNCQDVDTMNSVLGISHQLHNDLGNLGSFIQNMGSGDQTEVSTHFSQINNLMQKVKYNLEKNNDEATISALKHLMVSCNNLIKQAKEDAASPESAKDQTDLMLAASGLAGSMRSLLDKIKAVQMGGADGQKILSRDEVNAILKEIQAQVNELCKEDAMKDVFNKLEVSDGLYSIHVVSMYSLLIY